MIEDINAVLASGLDDLEDLTDPETESDIEQVGSGGDGRGMVTQPDDAERKNYAIPPKLVEDVQKDPEKIRPIARSMLAVNLHNLFKKVQHPATSIRDRLEFQGMLNKMAGLEAKEAVSTAGAGFTITINIPPAGDTAGTVIESTAKLVEDGRERDES